jgi:hypothetical protein
MPTQMKTARWVVPASGSWSVPVNLSSSLPGGQGHAPLQGRGHAATPPVLRVPPAWPLIHVRFLSLLFMMVRSKTHPGNGISGGWLPATVPPLSHDKAA